MTYKRFEDLPVWKAAISLAVEVYQLTSHRWYAGKADVRNQMRRAALSVSNNIAEGFERGTTNEILTFLYIARGSAGEVRSGCHFCVALLEDGVTCDVPEMKQLIARCIASCEAVSKQIRAWAQSLQDGDIRGQRYLTTEGKEQTVREARAQDLLARAREAQRQAIERSARAHSSEEDGKI